MSTLYGLPIQDPPNDHEPVEVLVVARCRIPADQAFDPARPETLWVGGSPTLMPWDALGLAEAARQRTIAQLNFGG